MITSLPNLLTMSRIAVIPVLVALFFVGEVEGWMVFANWTACVLFTTAGATDWLDGHLARSRKQISAVGRVLDPIADKLLVAAALLMLAGFGTISSYHLLPAVVILCREILVSGLREYLAEVRVGVPVSCLAKWKTGIQMTAIGFLIVGPAGPAVLPVVEIGLAGLWLAAALTLITGYDYMRAGFCHISDAPAPARPAPRPAPRRDPPAKPAPLDAGEGASPAG